MSERTMDELLVMIERRDDTIAALTAELERYKALEFVRTVGEPPSGATIAALQRDKGKALLDLLASEEQAEALQAKVARYEVALAFYADPETYFAVGFLSDPPCGEFTEDFDETEYGYKPGKRAREALEPPSGETNTTRSHQSPETAVRFTRSYSADNDQSKSVAAYGTASPAPSGEPLAPQCAHGKDRWEHCAECELAALSEESSGETSAPVCICRPVSCGDGDIYEINPSCKAHSAAASASTFKPQCPLCNGLGLIVHNRLTGHWVACPECAAASAS